MKREKFIYSFACSFDSVLVLFRLKAQNVYQHVTRLLENNNSNPKIIHREWKQQIKTPFSYCIEILLFARECEKEWKEKHNHKTNGFSWKLIFCFVFHLIFFSSKVGVVCSHCRRCRCSKWIWIWCTLRIGIWALCSRIPCIENRRTHSNGCKPSKPRWLPLETNHSPNHRSSHKDHSTASLCRAQCTIDPQCTTTP